MVIWLPASAILLDRMNLSARNGWLDEEGRVYIIFTIEEIKGALVIFRTHFEECLRMLADRALEIRGHGAFVNIAADRAFPLFHFLFLHFFIELNVF